MSHLDRLACIAIAMALGVGCAGAASPDGASANAAPTATLARPTETLAGPTPTAPPTTATPVASTSAAPAPTAKPVASSGTIADDVLTAPKPDPKYAVGRLPLGDGQREIVIAITRASAFGEPEPELALAIVSGGKITGRIDGFSSVTRPMPKPTTCDEWAPSLTAIDLGKAKGMRLGLVCTFGEDYFRAQEMVVLYRWPSAAVFDPKDMKRLWVGPGDQVSRSMDACMMLSRTTFRLTTETTLEMRTVRTATWTDQELGPELTRALKKDCKVKQPLSIDRFSVTPDP